MRNLLFVLLVATSNLFADSLQLPDGSRYEGEFRDGLLHGEGVLVWPNGDRYIGEFERGLMHGQGRIERENYLYEGQFEHGQPSGEGIEVSDHWRYEGSFKNGQYHGQGRLSDTDGDFVYTGQFDEGEIIQGRSSIDGETYEGAFENWLAVGEGVLTAADGVYRGTFEAGELMEGVFEDTDGSHYEGAFLGRFFHGRGILTSADGTVQDGMFNFGDYEGPAASVWDNLEHGLTGIFSRWYGPRQAPERDEREVLAERALYLQQDLLQQTFAALHPQRPGVIDLYVLQIAGDGSEEVFRREIEYARQLFIDDLDAEGRIVSLINSRASVGHWPMATRVSIERALNELARIMNPDEDILLLYMTSHGSDTFDFSLQQNGMRLPNLHAIELAEMLEPLALQHQVLIVSACFSGGFIPYLENERSTIMTAARRDRASFGCADENDMTDFGRALLVDNLGQAASLTKAFNQAVERVVISEQAQGISYASKPQMQSSETVNAHYRKWREQLRK